MTQHIPISLYIHIPWCIKKCPYCDFNSHQAKFVTNNNISNILEQDYITALYLDLTQTLQYLELNNSSHSIKPLIHSIFIGGGTPSLFSAPAVSNLLNKINNFITIPNSCEITLEANPGTFESKKFTEFKNIGINRLSIGVQSFNNSSLKLLGRIHDSTQAINAIKKAVDLDFNLNIDLMHSLPEQTHESALKDLELAVNFAPKHISWYQLTIEPNTAFAKRPPILPDDTVLNNIYYSGLDYLAQNNYKQYEISAFTSHPSFQSKHNLNYWRYGDYIGIGAGAHSKFSINNLNIIRQWKQKSPERYLNSALPKLSGQSELNQQEIILEYMMNRLRILEPLSESELKNYTHLDFSNPNLQQPIQQAIKNNWLIFSDKTPNQVLSVTELGRRFLNDLILLFA
ncbi:MAG: radical SAM family heme chaperone HemW [Gammaproteobacteria bacterium]|nr:radical SAM family heme chaperone HemW [Gammaproteobacteria bacterium]